MRIPVRKFLQTLIVSQFLIVSGCMPQELNSNPNDITTSEEMDPYKRFDDPKLSAALNAACLGDSEEFNEQIALGADVNELGESGVTPLFWVLRCNNHNGIKMVLDQGADPNQVFAGLHTEYGGFHPVNAASKLDDAVTLRLLLEAGGDPDGVDLDYYFQRPLLNAALLGINYGYWDNYELLLEYGADENKTGGSGTATAMLATFNHWSRVADSIERGYERYLDGIARRHHNVDLSEIVKSRHAGYHRVGVLLKELGFEPSEEPEKLKLVFPPEPGSEGLRIEEVELIE